VTDEKTITVYDDQVEKYANLVSAEKPGAILQAFMNKIPKGGLVLDLGCGPGNSAVQMIKHGLRVDAVDASREMVAYANKTYNLNARQATFDDLDDIEKYHGIWANFSLLHAPIEDFPKYLNAIHKALLPEGIFHIGMKLGDGMHRDSIGRMYSYYTEDELSEHLTNAGFKILDKTFGEEPGLSGEIAPWMTVLCNA
jgi:SAM-dependent methyltransferase